MINIVHEAYVDLSEIESTKSCNDRRGEKLTVSEHRWLFLIYLSWEREREREREREWEREREKEWESEREGVSEWGREREKVGREIYAFIASIYLEKSLFEICFYSYFYFLFTTLNPWRPALMVNTRTPPGFRYKFSTTFFFFIYHIRTGNGIK